MAETRICSVPECSKPAFARGWCHAHYGRWRKHGDVDAGTPLGTSPGAPMHFIETVALPYDGQDCLIWPFSRGTAGYGQIGVKRKPIGAHRIVCELFHGQPQSEELFAIHSCGNGHLGCVNPRHLRWGTSSDNALDAVAHGVLPIGARHHNARLTQDMVDEIRRLAGTAPQSALARKYGVAQTTISKIMRGVRWKRA